MQGSERRNPRSKRWCTLRRDLMNSSIKGGIPMSRGSKGRRRRGGDREELKEERVRFNGPLATGDRGTGQWMFDKARLGRAGCRDTHAPRLAARDQGGEDGKKYMAAELKTLEYRGCSLSWIVSGEKEAANHWLARSLSSWLTHSLMHLPSKQW